jgi:hypothetical protein
MTETSDDLRSGYNSLVMIIVAGISLLVYWMTAYRTITWWDNCSYATAAITFGITFPPGSLLLTILGWLVTQLPLGISKIFALNLFAGVQAVFVVGMVMLIGIRLVRDSVLSEALSLGNTAQLLVWVGVAAGCLNLAFSETMWRHAIKFTPYILTALFTTLLVWAMLRWWKHADQKSSILWLFLIMLLFGLDFSVHRTNILLLPGLFVCILLRNRSVLSQVRSWVVGGLGLLIGLAFHLLIIPIADRNPVLSANDPSNWSRFYDYISLKQYGGGWLFHIFPRQASFLEVQVVDYMRTFSASFFSLGGGFAILTLMLTLGGIVVIWRRDWRLSFTLLVLFLCSSLGAIIYFNLPKDFFWPMDRHYLPSFVILSVFIACGTGSALLSVFNYLKKYRLVAIPLAVLIVFSIPFRQLTRNYGLVNGSKSYFAYDYGQNILQNLQANSILFVAGDNYWPLFYLQVVENARPDVTVISPSLMNASWYVKQILSRDRNLPLTVTEEELSYLGPCQWRDTTIAIAVCIEPDSYQSLSGGVLPDSVNIRVQPTVAGRYLLAQDWLLVRMLTENRWRRPFYFTEPPSWLLLYSRREGLVKQIIPLDSAVADCGLLRENLMTRYIYRGYADSTVPIDQFSRLVGQDLFGVFISLAQCELKRGDTTACNQTKQRLTKLVPPGRIELPKELRQTFDRLCNSEQMGSGK